MRTPALARLAPLYLWPLQKETRPHCCPARPLVVYALGSQGIDRRLGVVAAASWPPSGRRAAMGRSIKDSQAYKEAKTALEGAAKLPKLIVFDLDYTAWPCWCEMYDATDTPSLFPETRAIIQACRDCNITMAVASRSPTPDVASAWLHKLGLTEYFADIQIIPYKQKDSTHFPEIRQAVDVPYNQMLFFDDENGNIARVSRLGVTSILVSTATGVNVDTFRRGIREHQIGR